MGCSIKACSNPYDSPVGIRCIRCGVARRVLKVRQCYGWSASGGDGGVRCGLTFAEQAGSIRAPTDSLRAAIEHHVEHSPRRLEAIEECLAQVDRLRRRLSDKYEQRDAHSGSRPVTLRSRRNAPNPRREPTPGGAGVCGRLRDGGRPDRTFVFPRSMMPRIVLSLHIAVWLVLAAITAWVWAASDRAFRRTGGPDRRSSSARTWSTATAGGHRLSLDVYLPPGGAIPAASGPGSARRSWSSTAGAGSAGRSGCIGPARGTRTRRSSAWPRPGSWSSRPITAWPGRECPAGRRPATTSARPCDGPAAMPASWASIPVGSPRSGNPPAPTSPRCSGPRPTHPAKTNPPASRRSSTFYGPSDLERLPLDRSRRLAHDPVYVFLGDAARRSLQRPATPPPSITSAAMPPPCCSSTARASPGSRSRSPKSSPGPSTAPASCIDWSGSKGPGTASTPRSGIPEVRSPPSRPPARDICLPPKRVECSIQVRRSTVRPPAPVRSRETSPLSHIHASSGPAPQGLCRIPPSGPRGDRGRAGPGIPPAAEVAAHGLERRALLSSSSRLAIAWQAARSSRPT